MFDKYQGKMKHEDVGERGLILGKKVYEVLSACDGLTNIESLGVLEAAKGRILAEGILRIIEHIPVDDGKNNTTEKQS